MGGKWRFNKNVDFWEGVSSAFDLFGTSFGGGLCSWRFDINIAGSKFYSSIKKKKKNRRVPYI